MSMSQRPGSHECFGYHQNYVNLVPDGDIIRTLEQQLTEVPQFIADIPAVELAVVHPPFGWAVHVVIEHCCDAERVFGYRALRFATGDTTDLPGWDENHFAACEYGNCLDPVALADEFRSLRQSNLCLLKRLEVAAFDRIGTANATPVSVRTLAWLMAGHWLHHHRILQNRLGLV